MSSSEILMEDITLVLFLIFETLWKNCVSITFNMPINSSLFLPKNILSGQGFIKLYVGQFFLVEQLISVPCRVNLVLNGGEVLSCFLNIWVNVTKNLFVPNFQFIFQVFQFCRQNMHRASNNSIIPAISNKISAIMM